MRCPAPWPWGQDPGRDLGQQIWLKPNRAAARHQPCLWIWPGHPGDLGQKAKQEREVLRGERGELKEQEGGGKREDGSWEHTV